MYISLHVDYPLFLQDFKETWNFSKYFFFFQKYSKYENLMKIRHVVAELFHVGVRTDRQTWLS
jgi:hypothetical protein